jgi:hypothetical protein
MGTTPKLLLPYVAPTDPVANYPAVSQDLATKVENAIRRGVNVADAFTAQPGWAISGQLLVPVGGVVMFYCTGTRTGVNIVVPPSTGLTNAQPLAQLDAVRFPVTFGVVATGPARIMSYTGVAVLDMSSPAARRDNYPDSASALAAFRRLLEAAARRGGTRRGRFDPDHPDDKV